MEHVLAQAVAAGTDITTRDFSSLLDTAAPSLTRRRFRIPPTGDEAAVRKPGSECVYLCGNSLGLQPIDTRAFVLEELDKWADFGVEGHFRTERPWVSIEDTVLSGTAALVGAASNEEVVCMNSLTANLHLLMVPFYRCAVG
jgi:kynureninase